MTGRFGFRITGFPSSQSTPEQIAGGLNFFKRFPNDREPDGSDQYPFIPGNTGGFYPFIINPDDYYRMAWRCRRLICDYDITFTQMGSPPANFAGSIPMARAEGAPEDFANAWGNSGFKSEDSAEQTVVLGINGLDGDFRYVDGDLYPYFNLKLDFPTAPAILWSELHNLTPPPPDYIPTYSSGVICEVMGVSVALFHTEFAVSVTGTVFIRPYGEGEGYRKYSDNEDAAIFDTDSGVQIITPTPQNIVR